MVAWKLRLGIWVLDIAEDFGLSFDQRAMGTGCGIRVMTVWAFGSYGFSHGVSLFGFALLICLFFTFLLYGTLLRTRAWFYAKRLFCGLLAMAF